MLPRLTVVASSSLSLLMTASAGACPGDVDLDYRIDVDDLLLLLEDWGPCPDSCPTDLDDSGQVDVDDLLTLLERWGECPPTAPLLELTFESHPLGLYDEDHLAKDWASPAWSQGVDDDRVRIVSTDEGANQAMAVSYPEGEYGTSNTGAQWKFVFGQSLDRVRLSYRIQFVSPFDFVKGGKLPGLIGGEGNTGGGIPSGSDGWSARMMWRTDGEIMQYVYHPDQPENFGDNMYWQIDGQPLCFEPGRWYQLVHDIQINTPGENDGRITCWLDGSTVLDRRDIRFRDVDDFAIDGMYFSTFFGGGSSSWATSADETVYFDDFQIVVP